MIVSEFLRVIGNYLQNNAGLVTVGIADPVTADELPAIVLELEGIRQLGSGLGDRAALITTGALPWTATIDLSNPVLPEEPAFRLLSPDRKELVLPHGGLVRADTSRGPLGPADLSVTVAGAPRPVVAGPAIGDQVQADPQVGRLIFGDPLPATGTVVANYFLGQWEQRTSRIEGVLHVTVRHTDVATVRDLSDAVAAALQPPRSTAVGGLHGMSLISLGSIQPPDAALANSRARAITLAFEFELEINQPESSGGIILRIPVVGNIDA